MRHDRLGPFLFAVFLQLAAPLASAQPPLVGILAIGSPDTTRWDQTIGDGLRKLGYKDGQSVTIDIRFAHGDIARYPRLARELIDRKPAVIFAPCGPSLRAIRDITRTLPVIAICADEKNFLGEVASLSRPGGYTTGMTVLSPESVGKRIELLREILPGFARLAVLYDSNDPIPANWRELERLQPTLGLTLQRLPVGSAEEIGSAFESMVRERAQAVFVFPSNRTVAERVRIAELARKHRIAAVSEFSASAEAGGLMSYGASTREWLTKTVPMYVDKILKGAKPAELPILQPTQFELVINLKTAREIGVKIPQSILARANRVIE